MKYKKTTTMLTGLAATAVGAVGVVATAAPASAATGSTGWLPTLPSSSYVTAQDIGPGPEWSRVICFENYSQSSGYYIDVTAYDQGIASHVGATSNGCVAGYLYNQTAIVKVIRPNGYGQTITDEKWTVGAGSTANTQTAWIA